jgi:hypothetical protein
MDTYTAGKRWGSAFIQGKRVGSMYKGGKCIYSADTTENLTQWHPRWAKIDIDAGYTEFTYTDELGASVSPAIAYQPVACVGNRQNGIIYYFASSTMFRKVITNGVVGNAEKLWVHSNNTIGNLSINEETGAVFMADSNSWLSKIVFSIETADTVAWQSSLHHMWQSPFPCWIQNKLLSSSRLYDGSDLSYITVPGIGGIQQNNALFGDSTALFIQQSIASTPVPIFRYNLNINTTEELFRPNPQGSFQSVTHRQAVYDSKTSTFLLPNDATVTAPIMRTTA